MEWERSGRGRLNGGAPALSGEDALRELSDLAASAGAEVSGCARQRSPEPDPATLVGRGKIHEICSSAHAARVECVVFANDLSPSQLRNLEDALNLKVIDRTQLILDIFARRARSREGKLQVELAQLNYLLPRLAGQGTRLSRLGGGIGTRGPGEQRLETDRRRVRARIQKLNRALNAVRVQRSLHREHRRERSFVNVALIGYTNAGKSTLFNALTGANLFVSARLFATLDPTVRALRLPSGRKALLSDTVGFIRDLPSHLIVAFRATLEELESAALLVHVIDASNPDWQQRSEAVEKLLDGMGIASTPVLRAWNKVDLIPGGERRRSGPLDVAVSARSGQGLSRFVERVDEMLTGGTQNRARSRIAAKDAAEGAGGASPPQFSP